MIDVVISDCYYGHTHTHTHNHTHKYTFTYKICIFCFLFYVSTSEMVNNMYVSEKHLKNNILNIGRFLENPCYSQSIGILGLIIVKCRIFIESLMCFHFVFHFISILSNVESNVLVFRSVNIERISDR